MNLKYVQGDLLKADIPAIAHGCNTKGVMGAGIAADIRTKFPEMYNEYKKECLNGTIKPGGLYCWRDESGQYIFNLFTQNNPGADAKLDHVRRSLLKMVLDAEGHNVEEIGLPKIGCGIGGLQWLDVNDLLLDIQKVTSVQLVIYVK